MHTKGCKKVTANVDNRRSMDDDQKSHENHAYKHKLNGVERICYIKCDKPHTKWIRVQQTKIWSQGYTTENLWTIKTMAKQKQWCLTRCGLIAMWLKRYDVVCCCFCRKAPWHSLSKSVWSENQSRTHKFTSITLSHTANDKSHRILLD